MSQLTVFRGRRVVLPGSVQPAAVHVRGVIEAVVPFDAVPPGVRLIDLPDDAALLPGLVDTHVHINEPGRTEWEGFESATRAAAAGGVTTLVDMPLNCVPATTTAEALAAKRSAAGGRIRVDVGFWGGVVPGNAGALPRLAEAGVAGFKCFLAPSGVDEFPHVGEAELRQVLPILGQLELPLLVHAELPEPIAAAAASLGPGPWSDYRSYLCSRPHAAEEQAIALLVELCRAYGAPTHVVHLSSARALPLVAAARQQALPLTVESCPHYLHFAAEDIPDGATEFKCAPPIRERSNREALWGALGAGTIDLIATDHSPAAPELKGGGDFARAWGGIASLQLGLAVVWTGARARGHSLRDVAEWMSAAPARLAGFGRRKGAIAPGCDADLVVFRPDAELLVVPEALHHRHKLTPYTGTRLLGVVEATYLRGELVYGGGKLVGAPRGVLLERERV